MLASRSEQDLWDPRRVALAVGAALAPDADLLFQFVDGRNHHGRELHSVGAALLAALVVYGVWRLRGLSRAPSLGMAVGGAWVSHVVLDYLNIDTNPPIGIMTDEQVAWYVATGEPMDKAGGYHVDGIGSAFIASLSGSPSNVAGLPVRLVLRLAREAGLALGPP